jgi:beta-glucosidase
MPGPTKSRGFEIELYSSLNMLRPSVLDARVRRVLQFIMKASSVPVNPVESQRNLPEDRELNRNLSAAGIVLLQNKIQTLPILKRISKISLVGSHIHEAMASGMGSTAVEPYYTITPYQALMDKAPNGVEVRCEVGAYAHKFLPLLTDRLMKNAVIRFFNEPSTVASRVLIDKVPIDTSYFQLVDYTHEDLNSSLFYTSFQATFSPDETGEWTFGLAVYGTAILYIDDELLIDNSEDQTLGSTFFGCGTDEKFGKIQLVAGKDYELRVEFGSTSTMQILSPEVVNFGGGGARIGACRELPPDVLIERAVGIASQADYTIICTGLSVSALPRRL